MEHTAYSVFNNSICGKLLVKGICEINIGTCRPLVVAEKVSLYLENECGLSLKNSDLTCCSCRNAVLVNSLVGDCVNTLCINVETAVILNNECRILVVFVRNAYTEHKIDLFACINLKLSGLDRNNGCRNIGLVSGAFLCASFFCAFSVKALAALFTYVLTLVSEKVIKELAGSHNYNESQCKSK